MQTEEWKPSPLISDIIYNKRAVLANAAHQSLVLELMSHYGMSLERISHEAHLDFRRLTFLMAGTLETMTLLEYDKLLCLYCFKQVQASAYALQLKSDQMLDRWRDLSGVSLGIYAKENKTPKSSKRKSKRYYIGDTDSAYLTQREHDVASLLYKAKCSYKAVAKQLGLSHRTIEFYVANLRAKLNVPSRHFLQQKLKQYFSKQTLSI